MKSQNLFFERCQKSCLCVQSCQWVSKLKELLSPSFKTLPIVNIPKLFIDLQTFLDIFSICEMLVERFWKCQKPKNFENVSEKKWILIDAYNIYILQMPNVSIIILERTLQLLYSCHKFLEFENLSKRTFYQIPLELFIQ